MTVKFSDAAVESLKEITDFLSERWTQKELKLLNKDLEKLIESFNDRIVSYPTIDLDSQLRFTLLGKKQVKVYFEVQIDCIEILLFLPSKGNPENINKLFNKE
jgi:plasmid stabilization system protein ParE